MLFQVLQNVVHDGDLADHAVYLATQREVMYDIHDETKCVVSLFGRTEDGRDICCHVHDFRPIHDICLETDDIDTVNLDDLLSLLQRKCFTKEEGRYVSHKHFIEFAEPSRRKSNHGFRNGETKWVLPIVCQNLFAYNRIRYYLRELQADESPFDFTVVNRDVDPFLRFWGDLYGSDCKICGWYDTEGTVTTKQPQTTCDIEIDVSYHRMGEIARPAKIDLNPHFKQICFDIETYTADRKKHGIDPTIAENVCICIGATVYSDAQQFVERRCFFFPHLGKTHDTEGALSEACMAYDENAGRYNISVHSSEKAMLEAFGVWVQTQRPDVILGYNSDSFDFWYIHVRAKLCGCSGLFYNMSRLRSAAPSFLTESTFESSGRGTITTRRPTIFGVFVLDVMIPIRDDVTKKYAEYNLKYVTKQLLSSTTKYDLPYETMFQYYSQNETAKNAEIIVYCLRDVELTQQVATVDIHLNKLVSMSNLMVVDILALIAKGQTIRCVSTLYANYTLPRYNYFLDQNYMPDDDLAGGHVVEPEVGYHDSPIIVLDFKSLYPSIMMAYKMDFSSIVHEPRYLNLPNVQYFHSESTHPVSGRRITATFAVEAEGVEHVIPTVLSELSAKRQAVKKQMKAVAEGSPEYMALNSVQNAIKVPSFSFSFYFYLSQRRFQVSMNSFYGFVGGQKFPIGAYAQSVTGQGRNLAGMCQVLIETKISRKHVQMLPQAPRIVYGGIAFPTSR